MHIIDGEFDKDTSPVEVKLVKKDAFFVFVLNQRFSENGYI